MEHGIKNQEQIKAGTDDFWPDNADNNSSKDESSVSELPYKVKFKTNALNLRKGPGLNHHVARTAMHDEEVYTIVEEKDGWGKLQSEPVWVSLDFVKKI